MKCKGVRVVIQNEDGVDVEEYKTCPFWRPCICTLSSMAVPVGPCHVFTAAGPEPPEDCPLRRGQIITELIQESDDEGRTTESIG